MSLKSKKIVIICLCSALLYGCAPKDYDWVELRNVHAVEDLAEICSNAYFPDRPLTLDDVLQIAFTQNLDVLAQGNEWAAQRDFAEVEMLKMIPPLTLDGFLARRSNSTATTIVTAAGPGPAQISSTQDTRQWDIRQTLNLIDLGLSYYKAKQERGKIWILEQQHLRIRQKLAFDISTSYWKAIVAQKTVERASEIIDEADRLINDIEDQIEKGNLNSLDALQQEAKLIDMHARLFTLKYQLESSKAELASYMGLPAGTCYELADVEIDYCLQPIDPIEVLEDQALFSRPELAVKDLEEQVSNEDIKMALLQMLPNASLYGDFNADGNPFLVHNNWASVGAKAAWNLLSIPQHLVERLAAKERKEQAYRSRLAVSVAVMAQVRLAYLNYKSTMEQLLISRQYADIKKRLVEVSAAVQQSGALGMLEPFNMTFEALEAEVLALKAYADYQVGLSQIGYTVGRPFIYADICFDTELGEEYDIDE